VSIPVSIWEYPYGNGDPLVLNSRMVTDSPRVETGTRQSPFPYSDYHIETGSQNFSIPLQNSDEPFLYGDVSIPVSIWEYPYGNGDPLVLNSHMETVITVSIWGSPNPFGDYHMEINNASKVTTTMLHFNK
jgi:hypothetical protein